jgi:putative transposase
MLNINPQLLDQLLKEYKDPQDLMGENGILKQLTKALALAKPLPWQKASRNGNCGAMPEYRNGGSS